MVILGMCMTGFSQNTKRDDMNGKMQNQTTNKKTMSDNGSHWNQSKTDNFVKTALNGGVMEKELGQMAVKRGNSKEVKDLGMMLAKNHSNADMKLESIAKDMNIDVQPKLTKDQQKTLDELRLKPSNEFSRAFVNIVVKNHQSDIAAFKEAEKKVPDGKLDNWIDTTLPVLEKHLTTAENVQKDMNRQSD